MRYFQVLFFLFSTSIAAIAQTTLNPNFGSTSHPMTISKIETTSSQTIIYLTIENQINGGSFCADKNIKIEDEQNNIYLLNYSEGIPTCPQLHSFTTVGEKLEFALYFPSIATKAKYLDITEQCNNACFTLKGVIINNEINTLINDAYDAYSEGLNFKALSLFKQAHAKMQDYPYGFIYLNIIKLYYDLNQTSEAENWEKKLQQSKVLDKDFILQQIKK